MRHGIKAAIVAAALLVLVACARTPAAVHHTDAAAFAAHTDSGLYIAGTVAPVGSFEWTASPVYSQNAMHRHLTALALKRGHVTLDEAQAVLDRTDAVRSLLDAAVAACAQNGHTNRCAGNEKHAQALLEQAKAALAAIH